MWQIASTIWQHCIIHRDATRKPNSSICKALELRRSLLGENHPDVAASLNNLAALYNSQGRYEQAESALSASLGINAITPEEKIIPMWQAASTIWHYSIIHRDATRQAEPLYSQALATLEQMLGANHPNTRTVHEKILSYFVRR